MKVSSFLFTVGAIVALLTGCTIPFDIIRQREINRDMELMNKRQEITNKFNNNPDTDAWYDQRQKNRSSVG